MNVSIDENENWFRDFNKCCQFARNARQSRHKEKEAKKNSKIVKPKHVVCSFICFASLFVSFLFSEMSSSMPLHPTMTHCHNLCSLRCSLCYFLTSSFHLFLFFAATLSIHHFNCCLFEPTSSDFFVYFYKWNLRFNFQIKWFRCGQWLIMPLITLSMLFADKNFICSIAAVIKLFPFAQNHVCANRNQRTTFKFVTHEKKTRKFWSKFIETRRN